MSEFSWMLARNHVICSILSLSNSYFCYRSLIEKAVLKWGRFLITFTSPDLWKNCGRGVEPWTISYILISECSKVYWWPNISQPFPGEIDFSPKGCWRGVFFFVFFSTFVATRDRWWWRCGSGIRLTKCPPDTQVERYPLNCFWRCPWLHCHLSWM